MVTVIKKKKTKASRMWWWRCGSLIVTVVIFRKLEHWQDEFLFCSSTNFRRFHLQNSRQHNRSESLTSRSFGNTCTNISISCWIVIVIRFNRSRDTLVVNHRCQHWHIVAKSQVIEVREREWEMRVPSCQRRESSSNQSRAETTSTDVPILPSYPPVRFQLSKKRRRPAAQLYRCRDDPIFPAKSDSRLSFFLWLWKYLLATFIYLFFVWKINQTEPKYKKKKVKSAGLEGETLFATSNSHRRSLDSAKSKVNLRCAIFPPSLCWLFIYLVNAWRFFEVVRPWRVGGSN